MDDDAQGRLDEHLAMVRRACLVRAETSDAALLAAIQILELEESLDEGQPESVDASHRLNLRARDAAAELRASSDAVVALLGTYLETRVTRRLP